MEPIISFVTTYAVLAKSQILLAAAWVQSQVLAASAAFAGATIGVQIFVVSVAVTVAVFSVILISSSIYKRYKHSVKKAEDGEEMPEEPEESEVEDPEDFLCPIGQELMTDPVTTINGKVYERKTIEMWLITNNTDPLLNTELTTKVLIPDAKLKADIDGYKALKDTKASVTEIKRYLADLNKPKPKADDLPPPAYSSDNDASEDSEIGDEPPAFPENELFGDNNDFLPDPPKKR